MSTCIVRRTESAQNLWLFEIPWTFDVYHVSEINVECPLKVYNNFASTKGMKKLKFIFRMPRICRYGKKSFQDLDHYHQRYYYTFQKGTPNLGRASECRNDQFLTLSVQYLALSTLIGFRQFLIMTLSSINGF